MPHHFGCFYDFLLHRAAMGLIWPQISVQVAPDGSITYHTYPCEHPAVEGGAGASIDASHAHWQPAAGAIASSAPGLCSAILAADSSVWEATLAGHLYPCIAALSEVALAAPAYPDFDRAGKGPNPTAKEGTPARAVVSRARFMGSESLVEFVMDHDGSTLRATVPNVFLPQSGAVMWLTIPRDRCFVFPFD